MIAEFNLTQRFLGAKFGCLDVIPDGVYAVPTKTNRGNAFMKVTIENNKTFGSDNFKLFWDESLKITWYGTRKPWICKESDFSKAFRKLELANT